MTRGVATDRWQRTEGPSQPLALAWVAVTTDVNDMHASLYFDHSLVVAPGGLDVAGVRRSGAWFGGNGCCRLHGCRGSVAARPML